MKMVKVFGLRNCDSCRKAVQALRAVGPEVVLHDVRAEPVAQPVLLAWLEAFGDELINRRSATWRWRSSSPRVLPAAELLAAYPAVMKRPLIEAGGRHWLGWSSGLRDQVVDAARD